MADASANRLHYNFAHVALPIVALGNPTRLFRDLSRGDGNSHLATLWRGLAARLQVNDPRRAPVLEKRASRDNYEVFVVCMPEPQQTPEAFFIAIAFETKKKFLRKDITSARYFTLELGRHVLDNHDEYHLCEWVKGTSPAQNAHINHRQLHAPAENTFIDGVSQILSPNVVSRIQDETKARIQSLEINKQLDDSKGASVPRFSSVVAGSVLEQDIEKPAFGEPFVRLGKLFQGAGGWMFQNGGVLGYLLSGKPILLGKMLGVPASNAAEYVNGLRARAAEMLAAVADEKKTFFRLFVVRELLDVGVDITARPPDKRLDDKQNLEFASLVMQLSFINGVGLGYHFAKTFREYWEHSYQMPSGDVLREMRAAGLVPPDALQPPTLEEEIARMASLASTWATESAGLFTGQEINQLKPTSEPTSTAPIPTIRQVVVLSDDAAVRQIVSQSVTQRLEGVRVTVASRALEVLEAMGPNEPSLAIIDDTRAATPQGTDYALTTAVVKGLLSITPALVVLLISVPESQLALEAQQTAPERLRILLKPFTGIQLFEAIQSLER